MYDKNNNNKGDTPEYVSLTTLSGVNNLTVKLIVEKFGNICC